MCFMECGPRKETATTAEKAVLVGLDATLSCFTAWFFMAISGDNCSKCGEDNAAFVWSFILAAIYAAVVMYWWMVPKDGLVENKYLMMGMAAGSVVVGIVIILALSDLGSEICDRLCDYDSAESFQNMAIFFFIVGLLEVIISGGATAWLLLNGQVNFVEGDNSSQVAAAPAGIHPAQTAPGLAGNQVPPAAAAPRA